MAWRDKKELAWHCLVLGVICRSWSREVLEQPSKYLKGMPPCPYAKQAWKQDKVMVVELEDIILQADKYCFDFDAFDKDLVILASL